MPPPVTGVTDGGRRRRYDFRMQQGRDQGRGFDSDWQNAVTETVRLFLLPPLLAFMVVAVSLLLFTDHLARVDLQTTFVVEGARQAD